MVRAWVCVAVLLLSACGPSEPGGVAGAAGDAAPTGVAAPPDESTETLLERAVAAMQAGRITRPVGDSALDLMVTLHGREPGNAGVQAALVELQPYVLLAGERSIASGDIDDAERLVGALAMFNPDAMALPRLREGLEQARQRSLLAADDAADAGADTDTDEPAPAVAAVASRAPEPDVEAPAVAAPSNAGDYPSSAGTAVGASPATSTPPAPAPGSLAAATTGSPMPDAAVTRRPPPSAAAMPGPAKDSPPTLVHDAAPEYPLSAMRRGLSGRVRLAFTVRPDGGVADVSVLETSPSGVFEEAAIAAARRWRFEPRDAPVGIERTLRFDLPRR